LANRTTYTHRNFTGKRADYGKEIVATLSRELSRSHFVDLFPIKDSLKRVFYAEMCRIEKWNMRTLRKKIGSMLYERTAISKKPELVAKAELEELRKEDQLSPDLVFRDPYVLQFLFKWVS
jgi:predicted nuclease of restriction endonuclease-like (RecB) superfamily